ncbi:glycosyltransferase family 2 protein [Actinocorallia sp. A-T 12471]|uniref:glycosyltransferase family 2 protein n=1 Tax=Actinocorallia sp. A-T 12471 TaxID=3089813 RepID=UPI0029CC10D9|nr:glycosyltransferase [Actinocorallia sp. A-T 12471]MDX6738984.1 glycosyltransferase [Actinocorallia sp. A-T 12471]
MTSIPTSIPTKISVVICAFTDRRWEDVLAAVESVRRQRHPAHEIILSVDHNTELYRRLSETLPDVRVVENAEARGLSGGKNTGVALAEGDVVAFLDDDAVAAPGWLEAFAAAYAADPRVLGVGGRTLSLWPGSPSSAELRTQLEKGRLLRIQTGDPHLHPDSAEAFTVETGRRPRWFPDEFEWTVGGTYRGMLPGPVRNVLGGNASFRRAAFEVAGGFSSDIGRTHAIDRPLGCEETEFCIRLGQRRPDAVQLFEPAAVIWHRVPAERTRFAYYRSRCYAEGLSKALVASMVGSQDGLSNERAHAFKTLPTGALRGVGEAARGDVAGLGRAGAITAGLAFTATGYLVGRRAVRKGG